MSGPGWFLPLEAVNEFQARTIQRTIDRAKHAHHTDVDMRINGQNEHHEADWIKHMNRVNGASAAPMDDARALLEQALRLIDLTCFGVQRNYMEGPLPTPEEVRQDIRSYLSTPAGDQRQRFEVWADDRGYQLKKLETSDGYIDLRTEGAWEAWQACASTPASAAPAAPKPLTEEDIWEAVKEAGLDWQQGWDLSDEPNRYERLVRIVETAHGITSAAPACKGEVRNG